MTAPELHVVLGAGPVGLAVAWTTHQESTNMTAKPTYQKPGFFTRNIFNRMVATATIRLKMFLVKKPGFWYVGFAVMVVLSWCVVHATASPTGPAPSTT